MRKWVRQLGLLLPGEEAITGSVIEHESAADVGEEHFFEGLDANLRAALRLASEKGATGSPTVAGLQIHSARGMSTGENS